MKTEFLKDLGLTEEQIKAVMAENGKDIQREQEKIAKIETERDSIKEQLDTAQTTLKEFEGVDVQELQTKVQELNKTLEENDAKYQRELAERDFNDLINKHISGAGAKNVKAVKALLDIDTLKESKNQEADIKAALEACQKENDYLFGAEEPINNPVGPTGGNLPIHDSNTVSLRAAMGLGEIKE